MSILNIKPNFLYPTSRQFPFDGIAEKIVRALENRNWKVPGITVDFFTYGSGESKYKMVNNIIGENFKLHFCRIQGVINNSLNNIAALHSVCIPKQILEVYDDESGPSFYLYVGDNWETDKDWFMNSSKSLSQLRNEPRRYLKYKGNLYCTRSTKLISDTDLDREYAPDGEPTEFNLEKKFKEFTSWLEENVLKYILSFPEEELVEEEYEFIPYSGPWPTIYSLCNSAEGERIMIGKLNPYSLLPQERHASFGSGSRLVPLYVSRENNRFPRIAYEGFTWCDTNQSITKDSKKEELSDCITLYIRSWKSFIVAVNLKYANDVFVADNAAYEETRQKIFKDIEPRDTLTDEELGQAYSARGATIVPINEYKGGYKEPIVLINRELDFDEIAWISD